jgi:hypothetical protein
MIRPLLRILLVTIVLAAGLAVPRVAGACSLVDAGCELDAAQYGLYETLTAIVWSVNRIILIAAYALDGIRWNVLNVAFGSAYSAIETLLGPYILPVGTLALVIAFLAMVALPIFGASRSPFNVRHILTWLVLAPVALTLVGPWLIPVEQIREDLGNQIFQAASSASFAQATLGAAGDGSDRMGPVQVLYSNGQSVCGRVLPRYSGGDFAAGGRRIDELVAAYLLANVHDIHCPNLGGGPNTRLPFGYYSSQYSPPFAVDNGIRAMSANERLAQISAIQLGLQRQLIGLMPATLALLYYLLNLVFALAMVALWAAFPLGMLIGFFQSDSSWVGGYVRKAAGVLQASWVASFVLGLLFAAIRAAAATDNGAVFAGVSLGGMFFTVYTLGNAIGVFKTALSAINGVLSAASGVTGSADPLALAGGMVRGVGRMTAGAVTGGASEAAGMAITAAAALHQSGSGRYALGAALGRFTPLATAAEAATGLGLVPRETSEAMRAGQASKRSFRAANAAMSSAGRFRQAAQDRDLDRQIARAERGTAVAGFATVRSDPARAAAQAIDPRRTDRALRLDAQGKLVTQQRIADDNLPTDAVRERLNAAGLRETLRAGAIAQRNSDGTYTHWNPATAQPSRSAQRSAVERRRRHRPPAFIAHDPGASPNSTEPIRIELSEVEPAATASPGSSTPPRRRAMYRPKPGSVAAQVIRDQEVRRAYRDAARGRINRPRRLLTPEAAQQRSFQRAMMPYRQEPASRPHRRPRLGASAPPPRLLGRHHERLEAEREQQRRARRERAISRTDGRQGRRARAALPLVAPPRTQADTPTVTPEPMPADPELDWLPE